MSTGKRKKMKYLFTGEHMRRLRLARRLRHPNPSLAQSARFDNSANAALEVSACTATLRKMFYTRHFTSRPSRRAVRRVSQRGGGRGNRIAGKLWISQRAARFDRTRLNNSKKWLDRRLDRL